MADPVLRALLEAPPDDEPETEQERQAVQAARVRAVSWTVVLTASAQLATTPALHRWSHHHLAEASCLHIPYLLYSTYGMVSRIHGCI
jgi:hypothetical protein